MSYYSYVKLMQALKNLGDCLWNRKMFILQYSR